MFASAACTACNFFQVRPERVKTIYYCGLTNSESHIIFLKKIFFAPCTLNNKPKGYMANKTLDCLEKKGKIQVVAPFVEYSGFMVS